MHDEDYFNTRECLDADPMIRGTGDDMPGCLPVFIAILLGCLIAEILMNL